MSSVSNSPHSLFSNYARFDLSFTHGQGCFVYDKDGKSYLDFVSGIAVNALGHSHPALVKAICEQAQEMLHCSNLYRIPLQESLADRLVSLSGLDAALFCNSGAEVNEAAIKLVRKYFFDQDSTRRTIITAEKSFHGRTLATLTATGQDKVKHGFAPLPKGFNHVTLNDLSALEAAIDSDTAAIMLEPLQAEGGVHECTADYLVAVRALCDKHGLLLIFDEIQTGIARCGEWFAYEIYDVKPDILTLAKGLGGGVPIGALLASTDVAKSFNAGTHGSTFGGNPLSCRAALTVLDTIVNENILANVQERSEQLKAGLLVLQNKYTCITQVRGLGLLIGCALNRPTLDIIYPCQAAGLLLVGAGANVLRFLPPLIVSAAEIEQGLAILDNVLGELD
ncbi:MAG: aspartate aminotransferase family protein [Mariprofundales bacterium]